MKRRRKAEVNIDVYDELGTVLWEHFDRRSDVVVFYTGGDGVARPMLGRVVHVRVTRAPDTSKITGGVITLFEIATYEEHVISFEQIRSVATS